MDAVKPAEGLSDLIGSGCSIREAITLHPASGGFRNKHEIKEFDLAGHPESALSPWHQLCVYLMIRSDRLMNLLAKRVALT